MLRRDEVYALRAAHHRSVLLFLTDRCPVGCAHCSVDSLRTSPTITDYALFERLLDGICSLAEVSLVGISGGEPFVERRGLTMSVDRLSAAGKAIVLYTSGVWAKTAVANWAQAVVSRAACVFLSTDAMHAERLPDAAFRRAARTVVDSQVGLVVQVINDPTMIGRAEVLLTDTFGPSWREHAELSLTPSLPYGRGAQLFTRPPGHLGKEFGGCTALAAPVLRYDGRMTACCNEQVIGGGGPAVLQRPVQNAEEVSDAVRGWSDDPLLGAIEVLGYGALTELAPISDLGEQRFSSVCDLCWRATPKLEQSGARTAMLLQAIVNTTRRRIGHADP